MATTVVVPAEVSDALFEEAGALQTGHFLLSSGLHSPRYFQCAKVMEHPAAAEKVALAMKPSLVALQPDVVVAPAAGAVLFGYELARVLGVRNVFAERPGGRFELRRGFDVRPGERVLLAENVITTGGSVLEVADLVRGLGAVVAGYAVVVDRSSGRFAPPEPVFAYGALEAPVFEPASCELCARGEELVKPGSRAI